MGPVAGMTLEENLAARLLRAYPRAATVQILILAEVGSYIGRSEATAG